MTPFDAVFIDSPRLIDALLRGGGHESIGDWAERFRVARARLLEAQTRIKAERAHQKRQHDSRHAPLPTLVPGRLVWIRLRDRPVKAAASGKTAPLKLGPFPVRKFLSPHPVLVDVPTELNIEI
ncbi:hypothetical protein A4X13_0g8788 [Tilletia indica]|uniref:Uncharacterized protein n=1 Tax=Tilletia indica TaxID=43049 RepID=A0A177T0G1_9BASI|nr:hypothetical protein A4X13_0g8788 [Tilletia indica]